MTAEIGIFDSGPLISFYQSDTLWLPEALFPRVVVSPSVKSEVLPSLGQMPDAFEVDIPHVRLLLPGNLGRGEREAIGLAIQIGCDALVIDDRPARKAAIAHGLPVIGTFGLLLKAKHQGLIGRVAPIMSAMLEAGHYASYELQMAVLEDAGEL